jgi:hypothetical protein
MPLIRFDPPNTQSGGHMNPETRKEFVSLCRQIQDRTTNSGPIVEQMLSIMRQDITDYIHSLSDEKEQTRLLRDVDTFYSTIDHKEKNTIGIYNTICFQIVIMMFMYEHRNESYNDYKNGMYKIKADTEGNWKNNRVFYRRLLKNKNTTALIHNKDGAIYLGFPGFIRLGELNESYLNNVFYIGVNYKTSNVDGDEMDPYLFFGHDMDHAVDFLKESSPFVSELKMYKELREFVTNHNPSHLYSIDLILFCILHETSIEKYNEATNNDLSYSVDIMMPYLIDNYQLQGFCDMAVFGSAIPKAHRVPSEENSGLLDETAVQEYLQLCIQRFSDALKEMRGSLEGGRYRKTRKRAGRGRMGRKRTGRKRVR